jgi:hypothetical protein
MAGRAPLVPDTLDRHLATLRQTWATKDGVMSIVARGVPNEVALLEVATPDFVSQGMARVIAVTS